MRCDGVRRPVVRACVLAVPLTAAMAALAPGAWASISPSVSLDQSAGTTAGSIAKRLTVIAQNVKGRRTTIHVTIRNPGL